MILNSALLHFHWLAYHRPLMSVSFTELSTKAIHLVACLGEENRVTICLL